MMTEAAEKYFNRLYPDGGLKLVATDPEFADFFVNFACDEVVNQDDIDDRTRMMAILAALLGCQGIDEFREILPGALNANDTAVFEYPAFSAISCIVALFPNPHPFAVRRPWRVPGLRGRRRIPLSIPASGKQMLNRFTKAVKENLSPIPRRRYGIFPLYCLESHV